MPNDKEEKYASERMNLDSAMKDYIEASDRVGFSRSSMLDDIADVIYDATDGGVKVDISEKE